MSDHATTEEPDGVGGFDDEEPVSVGVTSAEALERITPLLHDVRVGARRKVRATFDDDIGLDPGHFLARGFDVLADARARYERVGDLDDVGRKLLLKSIESLVAGVVVADGEEVAGV